MNSIKLEDFEQKLPDQMPISVVMEKKESDHKWIDYTFQAVGVISDKESTKHKVRKIHQSKGVEQHLFSGLNLKLHIDECESYYHNLMSPHPGCFIVAAEADELDEMPTPYLVSLSFDEVHAYLEGDEHVYAVEIPPELYKWTEAFILTHYVATKRTKRKLQNWKQQSEGSKVIRASVS